MRSWLSFLKAVNPKLTFSFFWLTGTPLIPSLAFWAFTGLACELCCSHTVLWTQGVQLVLHFTQRKKKKKRNMRHKMNSHGQGLAILYPVKIWAILVKDIKKAVEEMGTRNRKRAESIPLVHGILTARNSGLRNLQVCRYCVGKELQEDLTTHKKVAGEHHCILIWRNPPKKK